ncbi:MAG: NADP-dependent malic enzyme [Xanthomonadales bacterium]|nr:NADP-dependent malic enzyme [Xanthomonadales bacterium]
MDKNSKSSDKKPKSTDDAALREAAIEYHLKPTPGKIQVVATKALTTQKDLAMAYSPGVAAACELIEADPAEVNNMTSRGNLVAVITNGTAVLGLGDIGPLASKPVMEGKGVLFKKFAGIDVFDIEIEEKDPEKLIDIIASLEPTFGGINLEDIKAPECFRIETELMKRMKIPVFHDDQHGTAIIAAAAMLNALHLNGKAIEDIKLVASGAGAAGISCLKLLVDLGLRRENIVVCDSRGVIYHGRDENLDERKALFAHSTSELKTLADAIVGADAFLGVSVGGLLHPEMVASMADTPIIFALANPDPEIRPDEARAVKPDAIIATGRSDFPNQVNNVLCFPYLFRGALDAGATTINKQMQMACVKSLAALARMEAGDLSSVYAGETLSFGPEYLIPKPFDQRLLVHLAPAVAQAAMDSGVATRPIEDMQAYKEKLSQFVYRSGLLMKPVFDAARKDPKRVVFAEGEEPVILRALQTLVDDKIALPLLVGRPAVIEKQIKKLGLRIRQGVDFEITNPESDPRYDEYWRNYHAIMQRRGVSPDTARAIVRTRSSVIAALMVERGEADALITGVVGRFQKKLDYIMDVIGKHPGNRTLASVAVLCSDHGSVFIADNHVNENPDAETIADICLMAADKVRLFGITPKVALISHSTFGSHQNESSVKMSQALEIIKQRAPDLEVDGEMPADVALSPDYRQVIFPNSRLKGRANLLIMPNLDAAHVAVNLTRFMANTVNIGPILMGSAKPAHVLSPSATVRRVVNMTAIAVVEAQQVSQGTFGFPLEN